MDLSVIVVNFNNLRVLKGCLPSLMAALEGLDAEVILSDNGSHDGSLSWVGQNFPSIRILNNGKNLGFAEANNRAFAIARGRYLLLLNPDTIVKNGALQAMVAFLEDNPRAGAVGCKILNPDGSRQISARAFPTLLTYAFGLSGLAYRFPSSRWFGRFDMMYWDGQSARTVDWVSGAVLMIRREVLDRVGGIDPYFFLTYDEVDWCRRIKETGYKVCYTPQGEIVHLDRQSEPQANPKPEARIKYLTVERNSRVRYFVKHHGRFYAALVELLHLGLSAVILTKAMLFGTNRSAVALMEKRLLFRLYWQTALRVPRASLEAFARIGSPEESRGKYPLLVNPYLADGR